ncbi:MAG TPA: amidohydrolase family protein [Spirochaetia bacterium]|nr:amidohydrolase family protein [Spirochaetia bacterium]
MIIDAHAHYGGIRVMVFSDQQMIDAMDRYGIEKSLMSATAALAGDDRGGNDALYRMIKKYPKRIIGYCVPNPFRKPLEELKRCLDLGFRGVKLHPYGAGLPLDNRLYWPVYEEAQRRKLPLLFHTGGSLINPDLRFTTPEMIIRTAKQYPEVSFIAGHMGLERWLDLVNVAPQVKNLYLDITMSMPTVERIEMSVRAIGAGKVLFGSDMPLLNPAVPIGLIEEADISDEAREMILWRNISNLLTEVN